MVDFLFWIYLINLVVLILHEMDSVYWKEWDLFGLPGGAEGFLILHIPLLFAGIYGVVWISQHALAGWILSALLGAAGVAGFGLHAYFIRKGHREFTTPFSIGVLWGMLVFSLTQVVVTILTWPR
jgi:hypothetical protein